MRVEDLVIGRLYEHSFDGRVKLISIESEQYVTVRKGSKTSRTGPVHLIRTWAERERRRKDFDERRNDLNKIIGELSDVLSGCDIDAAVGGASVGRPGTVHGRMAEQHTVTVELDHGAAALLVEILRSASTGRSDALIGALGLDA